MMRSFSFNYQIEDVNLTVKGEYEASPTEEPRNIALTDVLHQDESIIHLMSFIFVGRVEAICPNRARLDWRNCCQIDKVIL